MITSFSAELEVREGQKVAKKRVFRPFHHRKPSTFLSYIAQKIRLEILRLSVFVSGPKSSQNSRDPGLKVRKTAIAAGERVLEGSDPALGHPYCSLFFSKHPVRLLSSLTLNPG